MPRLDGVDFSNHQGTRARQLSVDPAEAVRWAHDQGVRGAWFKATQGSTYKDPYYRAWRRQASELGFEFRGAYHWLVPGVSLDLQLKNFVDQVGTLEPGESIQLDCEDTGGLTDAEVIQAYAKWTDRYGDRVLVYCGRFYMGVQAGKARSYMIDRLPLDIPWWMPWYGSPTALPRQPVIWQWGGGEQGALCEPLQTRVDSNQFEDEARLRELSGLPARAPGGIPNEEDDMPFTEDQLRQMIRDEVLGVTTMVMRSAEFGAILDAHVKAQLDAAVPTPPGDGVPTT